MAADSMSLRDMLFWVFLTLFGTGTYVIYGSESVAGEVLGVGMLAMGIIGMVGCAWPHLKSPLSGKVKAIVIGIAIVVTIIVSIGFYRHFHSGKATPVADAREPLRLRGRVAHTPFEIQPPAEGWASEWKFKPPDLGTVTVNTSSLLEHNKEVGIMSIVRVQDDRVDITQDRRIVKSGVFHVMSNPITIEVPLDSIIAILAEELGIPRKPKIFPFAFQIAIVIVPLRSEDQAAHIATIGDVYRMGGGMAAVLGFTQSFTIGLKSRVMAR